MRRPRFLRRACTGLTVAILALVLNVTPGAIAQSTPGAQGDVIANLWEWNWHSVGQECTTVLGPDGYGGVQVAPPQDSYAISGHQWYDVYQPVDYNLTSRMGNEDQFKTMVATCRSAGVKVYVDAVINHMTGEDGVSYGGIHYTKYNYPGLYTDANFHHYPADCSESDGTVHNYNDYNEVTKCELLGLADLRTESEYVRDTIAGYLNKLISYGVSGFRVDAAKHIGQTDLAAIESRLRTTVDGTPPYLALEVALGSPDQLAPQAFEPVGSLLGFDYATQLTHYFLVGIAGLRSLTEQGGLLPSNKELVFVANHDSERDGSTLNYQNGRTTILANEFMLAWPQGTPEVYASFAWVNSDDPPPSDANGFVTDTNCAKGWACTDRNKGIVHMVAWHNYVAGSPTTKWYTDRSNLIAFSRGAKGWIAINNGPKPKTKTFSTGLPKGTYCDIIHGTFSGGSCSGKSATVKVNGSGKAKVTVKSKDAVAFDAADLVIKH
jgi:alpha-amylase